ncbi:50S ribosomal protein L11 methyltransferase [Marinomonas mediterranea]|jgi:[LSU ribosomal protein L11P]-lysine N-methyltransferase (EC 2.1.1.-)|uniref:Ribosomal protein L11 methyltransferase n=1 Tax=Marinomonas mediterranea (strain ATCC 700492 / JCM 21426 / NBRC 103028 / MMB-1) TaxID=717774 RepID=F2K2C8_MARM1|nr:50S ribosomal protein L11 methyltransferase [Marinomonas mediterranea]ADZ92308.1 Ribosomal protein L11 methyltransferase [Marinomonas mediterranea MMB-1]WCN10260.1 50S ribosomal protein L11 methyltransferase [Marinomonas mediterranea]WCN14307.1 50S ribosomal protein L11 methyltransferase [Marinomonas mediterranea]WCN18359.1 50S ribosomal protein L11 methyltransferase [Marinomonas mediterranea MMB-1]
MSWLQIRIHTTPDHVPAFEDSLLECGAMVVTFEDVYDDPVYEPDLNTTPLWKHTKVTGLFEADSDIEHIRPVIEHCAEKLGQTDIDLKIEILEDKDWIREWMDNYHPIKFGNRLWVCPTWREVPDEDAITLMLDPGLAFGTGTHPTTALCLEWLDSVDCKDKTIIDYGCGSGILGVAGLLLGAKQMIGIDIDPQAVEATRANAERNNIESSKYEVKLPPYDSDLQADLVVANILAGPLAELSSTISATVKTGGKLALSGVLANQAEDVVEAYKPWFDIESVVEKEEWIRIVATKK